MTITELIERLNLFLERNGDMEIRIGLLRPKEATEDVCNPYSLSIDDVKFWASRPGIDPEVFCAVLPFKFSKDNEQHSPPLQ